MKYVEVLEPQVSVKKVGRPKAIGKDDLLRAIRDYATDSPSILAEKLHVSRMTVHRRLREIPREKIDSIVRMLADSSLKPAEMDFTIFEQIPIVREYADRLLYNRKVSDGTVKRRIRTLHKICVILRLRPSHVNRDHIEECAVLVGRVERGEILIKTKRGVEPMGVNSCLKTLRSWFQCMHSLSSQFLTSHGIRSPAFQKPKRARARLTREHRRAFMKALEEMTEQNFKVRKGNTVISIKFGDRPDLRDRMLLLPKALYYWGSRKTATFEARIEDVQWHNPIAIQKVIDKGRRTWYKRIAGEFLREFRALYETLGRPKEGRWFVFPHYAVVELFKECYRKAGIPEAMWKRMPTHIWRHTACQDLLEATNYNYELTAEVLGWESIDTMKKYYGRLGAKVVDKGMLEAMGVKVEWEKREFNF